MNLWDLEIDKIPCGWEKTYQEALVHCPNGENIEFDDSDSERTFFHPVKCQDLIINKFNTLKKKQKYFLKTVTN